MRQTSLLRLEQNLFAKAEYENPTGSVKDRAAKRILEDAVNRGVLKPGGTVIEATSGNMGIALAAVCREMGCGCVIVMPDSMSRERRQMMQQLGAEVVLTPGKLGMTGAQDRARRLAAQMPGSFLAEQFRNPANALAHYATTGPEIWAQTAGKVDIFVAGVGTGGTITGVGRFLKEQRPDVRIVAVEPAESPLLSAGWAGSHGIQGIGPNFVPEVLDLCVIDAVMTVTAGQAMDSARDLAKSQGIFAGISSGAACHCARLLARQHPDKTVVTLLADAGDRYASTGLFDGMR